MTDLPTFLSAFHDNSILLHSAIFQFTTFLYPTAHLPSYSTYLAQSNYKHKHAQTLVNKYANVFKTLHSTSALLTHLQGPSRNLPYCLTPNNFLSLTFVRDFSLFWRLCVFYSWLACTVAKCLSIQPAVLNVRSQPSTGHSKACLTTTVCCCTVGPRDDQVSLSRKTVCNSAG